jgi:hypothetical protein
LYSKLVGPETHFAEEDGDIIVKGPMEEHRIVEDGNNEWTIYKRPRSWVVVDFKELLD